jgi:hypothetical protein
LAVVSVAIRKGWQAFQWQQHEWASLLVEQALDLFLSSRLALLCARLAAGADAKGDSSGGSLAELLRELATLVQDTICQASVAPAHRMHICPLIHMNCLRSSNGSGGLGCGFVQCSQLRCQALYAMLCTVLPD